MVLSGVLEKIKIWFWNFMEQNYQDSRALWIINIWTDKDLKCGLHWFHSIKLYNKKKL